ncbi:uncharacterized protein LOC144062006 [Vanacampus margaritifer]
MYHHIRLSEDTDHVFKVDNSGKVQKEGVTMKAAACAVLLLLALAQVKALKCNYCFSKGSDLCNPTSTQTCTGSANACASVILQGPLSQSFRQCMNMAVCQGFIKTPGAFATCCSTDLCN